MLKKNTEITRQDFQLNWIGEFFSPAPPHSILLLPFSFPFSFSSFLIKFLVLNIQKQQPTGTLIFFHLYECSWFSILSSYFIDGRSNLNYTDIFVYKFDWVWFLGIPWSDLWMMYALFMIDQHRHMYNKLIFCRWLGAIEFWIW